MLTKINGGLLALDESVRRQVMELRDRILGRFSGHIQRLDVELAKEEGTGYTTCSVSTELNNGLRILGRHRDRNIEHALTRSFELAATQVIQARRRRMALIKDVPPGSFGLA